MTPVKSPRPTPWRRRLAWRRSQNPRRPSTSWGLGNAPVDYCSNALAICEALSQAFLSHFRERGFKLSLPPHRMTVITLKDAASYRALPGEAPGRIVGGHYDLETNRLVVFDFRPTKEELAQIPSG